MTMKTHAEEREPNEDEEEEEEEEEGAAITTSDRIVKEQATKEGIDETNRIHEMQWIKSVARVKRAKEEKLKQRREEETVQLMKSLLKKEAFTDASEEQATKQPLSEEEERIHRLKMFNERAMDLDDLEGKEEQNSQKDQDPEPENGQEEINDPMESSKEIQDTGEEEQEIFDMKKIKLYNRERKAENEQKIRGVLREAERMIASTQERENVHQTPPQIEQDIDSLYSRYEDEEDAEKGKKILNDLEEKYEQKREVDKQMGRRMKSLEGECNQKKETVELMEETKEILDDLKGKDSQNDPKPEKCYICERYKLKAWNGKVVRYAQLHSGCLISEKKDLKCECGMIPLHPSCIAKWDEVWKDKNGKFYPVCPRCLSTESTEWFDLYPRAVIKPVWKVVKRLALPLAILCFSIFLVSAFMTLGALDSCESTTLTKSEAFGSSVAIDGDTETIVAGAPSVHNPIPGLPFPITDATINTYLVRRAFYYSKRTSMSDWADEIREKLSTIERKIEDGLYSKKLGCDFRDHYIAILHFLNQNKESAAEPDNPPSPDPAKPVYTDIPERKDFVKQFPTTDEADRLESSSGIIKRIDILMRQRAEEGYCFLEFKIAAENRAACEVLGAYFIERGYQMGRYVSGVLLFLENVGLGDRLSDGCNLKIRWCNTH